MALFRLACGILAAACVLSPAAALARPRLAVAPLEHQVPNVREGLAGVLCRELQAGGRFDVLGPEDLAGASPDGLPLRPHLPPLGPDELGALAGAADYLLVGKVEALEVTTKAARIDLGGLGDLGSRLGGGEKLARVAIEFVLLKLPEGTEVLRFTAEGLESRHGVSVKPVRLGWLGTVNFEGDEFRQSMLGRAAYKALGEVLNELYDRFPLMGSVLYAGGSSLVLDIGQDSGLRLGDELNVYRMQALADDSGKPVWTDEERVGSARVVEFQDGRALCLVLDGQESITAGDIVRPLIDRRVLPQEADRTRSPQAVGVGRHLPA